MTSTPVLPRGGRARADTSRTVPDGAGPRGAPPRPSVLVLANRLPYPLDDGWKMRTFHVLRALASRGDLTLLSFHDGDQSTIDGLRSALGGGVEVITVPAPRAHSPLRLLLGLVTRTPVYLWNQRSAAFESEVRRLASERSFGVVVAQLSYMYPYLRHFPRSVVRAVDTHNIDSLVLRRYAATMRGWLRRAYAAITARKLERHEARVFADADLVWVCSEADGEIARGLAPRSPVRVVPNGVDTAAFAPREQIAVEPRRLVFFGRMDYFPNRDGVAHFVEAILPEIRRTHPDVELWVVGGGAGPELRQLEAEDPAVRVVGRVDDLPSVLASAAAVVVPLRVGGGTRLKILEALSMGRPVVSTSLGAEGLDVVPGRELLIADTPGEFAAATLSVLADPERGRRLGAAGRRAVRRTYDWRRVGDLLTASLGWRGEETADASE